MKKLLLFFVLGATLQVCSKTRDDSKLSDIIPKKLNKSFKWNKQKIIKLKNDVITSFKRAITHFVKTPDTSPLNTGEENNEKSHTLCRDNCGK